MLLFEIFNPLTLFNPWNSSLMAVMFFQHRTESFSAATLSKYTCNILLSLNSTRIEKSHWELKELLYDIQLHLNSGSELSWPLVIPSFVHTLTHWGQTPRYGIVYLSIQHKHTRVTRYWISYHTLAPWFAL